MISFKPLFGWLAENGITINDFKKDTGISDFMIKNMKRYGKFRIRCIDTICTVYQLRIEDIMRYEP